MNINEVILGSLIFNHEYCRRVSPHLKEEYFESDAERKVFKSISKYIQKYLVPPTVDAILIDVASDKTISEATEKDIDKLVSVIKNETAQQELQWLVDKTEDFCKERAAFNGLHKSLNIFKEKKNYNQILEVFRDALSVSFDTNIGHSYFDDHLSRWDYYNKVENKIPYRIDYMNKITMGGLSRGTMSVIYAAVHTGKTAHMCSLTADNLLNGNNVLYISNEMASEEIALRIDVKLIDCPFDVVKKMEKENFGKKINTLKTKTHGKLIIKQYPTATAHVGHIRSLLDDLKLKQSFIPDVIYIDYLNICASERIKPGSNVNSYTYIKSVAEELRGLAVERNIVIITAAQITRGSLSSSDIKMEDVSESIGIAHTSDLIYALSASEDLIQKNLILVKQLKNRFRDMNLNTKFFLKFDRSRMNFTDSENPEEGIIDGDTSETNSSDVRKPFDKSNKKDFSKFTF